MRYGPHPLTCQRAMSPDQGFRAFFRSDRDIETETTEVVAPPPGDYESKTAIVSYTKLACFQPIF